jgi:hypothetical protein
MDGNNWGGAGAILGMIAGHQAQRRQHRDTKELMGMQFRNQLGLNKQGHEMQMDMWNKTNYGAQVDHMLEAGLNPALMYGSAGQGGTTGSQGGGSASMGQAQQMKMMDMQNLLLGAQVEKLNAETNNIKKDTEKKGGELDNLIKTGKLIDAQEIKTINEGELKGFEADIKEIDKNWLKENNLSTMSIKELKLINEATGGSLGELMGLITDRVKEITEFAKDPAGKTKEYWDKGMDKAEQVINEAYEKMLKSKEQY